jgi:hypothetical protein
MKRSKNHKDASVFSTILTNILAFENVKKRFNSIARCKTFARKKNNDDLEQKEWVRVAVQLLCTNHRIKVSMQKHQDE